MKTADIIEAWAWIRKNNQTIPDDVLDFMKDSAIRTLDESPSPSLSAEQEAREYAEEMMKEVMGSRTPFAEYLAAAYLAGKASGGDGWIRVEDVNILKREGWSHSVEVNILYADNVVSTGIYSFKENCWRDFIYVDRHNIVAFQPLPTPPVK